MHLETMGACVAWNPEIAPHATVMNMSGKNSFPSGWRLSKVKTGNSYPPKNSPPVITTAMAIRRTPNTGYSFPMSLLMGRSVDARK